MKRVRNWAGERSGTVPLTSRRAWLPCVVSFFLLVFVDQGKAVAPSVQPVNGEFQTGVTPNSFTINFTVTPSVPSGDITWFFGTQNITNDPGPFREISSDRLSLVISPVTSFHEGVYTLQATNTDGTESAIVRLSVESEPGFQTVPDDQQRHERLNTTLMCFATGVPTPEINWFFDGSRIIPDGTKHFIGPFGDENYGSLTIYDLEFADAGLYTCMANNTHGSNSVEATLEVQVFPVILVPPVSANITAGSTDTITCTARGFPFNDVYWQKNGQNITIIQSSEIATYTQTVSEPNMSELTVVGTLQIEGPVLSTGGNFSCIAKNFLVTFEEAFSREVEIFVQYPPSTKSTDMVTVNQTNEAVFNCSSFGIPPPTIAWYSSLDPSTPLMTSGVISIEYSSYFNDSGLQIQTSVLTISTTSRALHEANYTCQATNGIENLLGTLESAVTELIVQVPPSLRSQDGDSLLGIVTNTITLTVIIDNASPAVRPDNIQWVYRNISSSLDSQFTLTEVAGSQYSFSMDRQSLTISDLTHENEGLYIVTVSNEAGSDTLELTLNIEAAPNITIFPMDTDVLMDYNATFTCGATSEPPHDVQWRKGAQNLTNDEDKYVIRQMSGELERETVSSLTVLSAEMSDTDDYTCIVSNVHGTQSHTAHLEVQVPPVLLTVIDNDTNTVIGIFGESSNISCRFFGSPVPDIVWLNDSVIVNLSNPYVNEVTSINGFTRTSTLVFSDLNFFDDAQYICQASNNLFNLQTTLSPPINLIINHPPLLIAASDGMIVVNQAQNLNITCTFLARPIPDIVWTSQEGPSSTASILMDDIKYNIFLFREMQGDGVSSLSTSILEIVDLGSSDTLDYTCTATNMPRGPSTQNESASSTHSVTVQTSPIVTRLSNAVEIGVKGNNVTLFFDVTRDVPLVVPQDGIKWYLIRSDDSVQLIETGSRYEFSPNRTSLTITDLVLEDQGTYSLNASNIIGNDSDTVFLDVQRSPVITNNSGIVTQVLGRDAFFECVAVSEPVHISRWLFNSAEIFTSDKYLIQGNGTTASNLTVYNITTDDEGNYTCRVDNAHGADEEAAQLQVQVPPMITQQPQDTNVLVNRTVSLTCCASGAPTPVISWLKDSQQVTDSNRITVSQEGECGNITIEYAMLSDTALYQCVASNTLAEPLTANSSMANILVQYPPDVYSLQQTSFTRNQSDEFVVECTAFGVPLPDVYWIPGPLKQILDSPDDQLLSEQQVDELLASASSFNGSRLLSATSQCTNEIEGSGSGQQLNQPMQDACLYDTGLTSDCSLSGSLWSVPCVLSVTNRTDVDADGRGVVVSRLRICSILKSDELSYTCVAVNNIQNAINTPEGAYANLIVQVPPEVVAIEDAVTAFRDRDVTLNFQINNASPDVTPEDITWTFVPLRGDRESRIIPSSDSHYVFLKDRRSLQIVDLVTNDAGTYTLMARNPAGNTSAAVMLDVQALPDIILFNDSMQVRNNETVRLNCFADGSPIQNVTWMLTDEARGGELLYAIRYVIDNPFDRTGHIEYDPLVNDISVDFLKETFSIDPPDTSPNSRLYGRLTIRNISPFEAGVYSCTLENKFGFESRNVSVNVQLNPIVAEPPIDTTCVVGKSCVLSCLFNGVPSPDVSFLKNGSLIEEENGIQLLGGVSNYTHRGLNLSITETDLSTAGVYSCQGINQLITKETTESDSVTLTVYSPANISRPLVDTIGNETFGIQFTCTVTGIPRPTISWFTRPSADSKTETPFFVTTNTTMNQDLDFGLMSVTSTIEITDLDISDQLTYVCRGENGVDNMIGAVDVSSADLTVQIPPTVVPLDDTQIHTNGSEVVVSFNITRAFPSVSLQDREWSFVHINETEIALDPSCVNPLVNCSDERYSRYNFSSDLLTLTIYSVRVADFGLFSLTVKNPAGMSTNSTNITIQVPPQFFHDSGRLVVVNESDTFRLNCTVDGIPEPDIFWFAGGTRVLEGLTPRAKINQTFVEAARASINTVHRSFGFQSILEIENAASTDQTEYTCSAGNGVGQRILLAEPYNVIVERVQEDFCSSSPCVNGICTNAADGFTCTCSEGFGGARCNEEIVIEIPPTITRNPVNQFVNLFELVTLRCDAVGQPSPTLRWLKDGAELGRTGPTLSIPDVSLNSRGEYTCVADNGIGEEVRSESAIVNILDIIQYTANLTVQFNQISGNNLTRAVLRIIENINSQASRLTLDNGDTFFAINLLGMPINVTKNITVPILVTIRIEANDTALLRQGVETAVQGFGFALQINEDGAVQVFDRCEAQKTTIPSPNEDPELDIILSWPETLLGDTTILTCPCNLTLGSSVLTASRTCGGNFRTGADWNIPMQSNCDFSVTARELCRLANLINDGEILGRLREVTSNVNNLGSTELTITTALFVRTESASLGNDTLTLLAVDSFDNTLRANRSSQIEGQLTSQSQGRAQSVFFNLLFNLPLSSSEETIVRDSFATRLSMNSGGQNNFNTSSFSPNISSVQIETNLNQLNMTQFNTSVTNFANDGFFIELGTNRRTISSVLDFSVVGVDVRNLRQPNNFTFILDQTQVEDLTEEEIRNAVQCAFWDETLDNGRGAFSNEGCETFIDFQSYRVNCSCNHLTSFSILLDVEADQTPPPIEAEAFSSLTYIGISISVVCLLFTIFTYLYSPKLRQSEANQLLVNLCFALLGLYLTFFLAAQGSKISTVLCVMVGALLHYFLLVVFFVMSAEAIDLFIKLVIVLGSTIQHYLKKAVIIAWILPAFIVPFTVSPHHDAYVNAHYCGATGPALYVGVLVPFFVVYIFNNTIFFIIMFSLIKKSGAKNFGDAKRKNRKQETKQQCRVAFTISVLFGLGWGFGLPASQAVDIQAIRVIFGVLFTVFVAFQGFFIFLLYIVLSPNAKKEWKRWILRKEDRKDTTSSIGGSSRSTASTTSGGGKKVSAASYKNYTKRRGGTLYHNVYSSQSNTTNNTNVTTEFTSGAFDSEQPMLEELQYNIDNDKTFMNPLDEFSDTFSMLSDQQETQSIGEAAEVSNFPNPKPPLSLEEGVETILTAEIEEEEEKVDCTTLDNPFLVSKGKEISIDDDGMELLSQEISADNPANSHVFSFDLSDYSPSQGLSEATYTDDKVLIKPPGF